MSVLLIWVIRFICYGGLAILAIGIIAPAIGGTFGLLVTAPLAGLAIAIDVFLTAKIRKTTVENIVSSRLLIADSVLAEKSKEGENPVPELETSVVEIHRLDKPEE